MPNQIDADKIMALRRQAGKGRCEVARLAKMSNGTLRFWENGKEHEREPRIDSVWRLAEALSTLLGRCIVPQDLYKSEEPAPKRRRAARRRANATTDEAPTDAAA